jgi:putative ABC transport system substrate-binding protein
MGQRSFLRIVASSPVIWPFAARAQQPARVRRFGVLLSLKEQDPESKTYIAALLKPLEELGWTVGNNLQVDYRWTADDADRIQQYAAELVALAPDVILAAGSSHVGTLQKITRTVPIVFVQVADAVGNRLVESLAHPGGNATGLTNFEFDISGKWLELLKQIAPRTTRTAVLRDSSIWRAPNWPVPLGLARSLGVEVSPVGLGFDDAHEIEHGITEFAEQPNGALIILPNSLAIVHRELIISLTSRYRLPTIYPSRSFVIDGGLMSYGLDAADQYRRAAGYVDRILKGKKPAHLPVEQATKLELVINLKTAKALGFEVPPTLLAAADEVIE